MKPITEGDDFSRRLAQGLGIVMFVDYGLWVRYVDGSRNEILRPKPKDFLARGLCWSFQREAKY
jgi:hypothetical protein